MYGRTVKERGEERMTKKVSKESLNISEEKIEELKKVIPEVFTEGKIDFEKLQRTLGNEIDGKDEKYSFNWAGRKETFKNIQTTAKGTLKPAEKESINWDSTENLFIEGDNLEVLKLLQKAYFNKIKMIYIDPPYNTGKDFVYKDNFKNNIQSYLEQTGQSKDGIKLSTNVETNGRFHSDWISMIYPRLFVARNLLREDGVIFVSIDDNEVHNLRKVMDEVFGEENFVADIIWNSTKSVTNTALISVSHTHNLVYAKSKDYYIKNRQEFRLPENGEGFSNPDKDQRGPWKADPFQVGGWRPNQQYEIKNPNTGETYKPNPGCSWKNDYKKFQELMKDNRIVFGASGEAGPQRKRFLSEAEERGRVTTTIWNDIDTTTNATSYLKKLFGESIFDNPKPVSLIQRMLQLCTAEDDIVLDFFAGSATTAHSVLQQNLEDNGNRKFICVQLPETIDKNDKKQKPIYDFLKKLGKPNNISEISKERIRRVIKEIEKEQKEKSKQKKLTENKKVNLDLGFKVFKLDKSNYKIWEKYEGQDAKELKKQLELFKTPLISGYKNDDVIYECIIKEGYSLNSKIEKTDVKSNKVFKVVDGEQFFYICLDSEIKDKTLDELKLKKDQMFVCLDEALTDSKKKNLSIQCNLKVI